jgi:hypothetical protein
MNPDGTFSADPMHPQSFNQSLTATRPCRQRTRAVDALERAPGKDAMSLYSANPDGTDLQLYYGADSHMTAPTTRWSSSCTRARCRTAASSYHAPVHRRR